MTDIRNVSMSIFDDLLGGTEKERRRERLNQNRARGQAAEDLVEVELLMEGYEVERVHAGADFVARRRDFLTNEVVEEKVVEVKSRDAQLSELQKERRRNTDNYEVRRRDPWFGL